MGLFCNYSPLCFTVNEVQFGDLQSEEKRHILISATIPKISKVDPCFKFFECEISYKNLVQNTQDKETLTATINRSGKIGKANLEVDISKNRVVAAVPSKCKYSGVFF